MHVIYATLSINVAVINDRISKPSLSVNSLLALKLLLVKLFQWDCFSEHELEMFLEILRIEEEQHIAMVKEKYEIERKRLQDQLTLLTNFLEATSEDADDFTDGLDPGTLKTPEGSPSPVSPVYLEPEPSAAQLGAISDSSA